MKPRKPSVTVYRAPSVGGKSDRGRWVAVGGGHVAVGRSKEQALGRLEWRRMMGAKLGVDKRGEIVYNGR